MSPGNDARLITYQGDSGIVVQSGGLLASLQGIVPRGIFLLGDCSSVIKKHPADSSDMGARQCHEMLPVHGGNFNIL